MEMYDWQTHCSTRLKDRRVIHVTKKLYSATGCESDGIASEEHTERYKGSPFLRIPSRHETSREIRRQSQITSDGSFSASTREESTSGLRHTTVEACFCHSSAGERKRLVLLLKCNDDAIWELDRMDLYKVDHLLVCDASPETTLLRRDAWVPLAQMLTSQTIACVM